MEILYTCMYQQIHTWIHTYNLVKDKIVIICKMDIQSNSEGSKQWDSEDDQTQFSRGNQNKMNTQKKIDVMGRWEKRKLVTYPGKSSKKKTKWS